MSSRKSTAPRAATSIDLVLCAAREGRLYVLVTKLAGGKSALPFTWIASDTAPDDTARALVKQLGGNLSPWLAAAPAVATKRHPADASLSLPFVGVVSANVQAPAGTTWCPVEALPALSPRQRELAEGALTVLRLHMDASPVAFRLLAPTFTLSDLQQAYELLLGRRLHKASFRRALQAAYLVEPTDEWRSEGRGRPAQLFKYAPRKRRGGSRAVRFDLLGG